MAGMSYSATPPMAVISPQFCMGYPIDLVILRQLLSLSDGNFIANDVNGNNLFRTRRRILSFKDRHVLLDAAGNPLVTFQKKMLSAHGRWKVFRGESTEEKDLIFSVKKSSLFQIKTKLHVFMAPNTSEEFPDFRIEGSWFDRSCIIYDSNNVVVAQMHKRHTAQSILLGRDTFGVTVYSNVDYAFVVALIVILQEIHEEESRE
ncbi:hypothetical protein M569_00797 [Genlisea aurea]|uniref:Uncharacterized protein n=1 Tax=Genlisea aurea TaxID=192259 RepID=S8D2L2_9LAMI|nr:hypothetical protein M569_00797 [Genlisea aurea]